MTKLYLNSKWTTCLINLSTVVSLAALSTQSAIAQIIPDNTLGREASKVTNNAKTPTIPSQLIEGGAKRGANLFHSFSEFNIAEQSQAYFANPLGIENILSRVTGNNSSQILGKLGVLGNANLFLLNPHGIIFGKNATLDIKGSFFATTADGIKLGETGLFSASNPQESNLLSVQPGALFSQALKQTQSTISNRGNLTTGKNLTLAAYNLNLEGQLTSGGDLQLLATHTLNIQDSPNNPFIATAQGNLLLQGNQTIDIFALNHPQSGLFSGRDMVLRSDQTIKGDIHYGSGGKFQIQKLDGNQGDLFSEKDPIILAQGDVSFDDYTGASLHILAGGSVTINTITINGTDATANTINPNNPNSFLASLATFQLSDGTPIVIDGSKHQTVDIRAGIDWSLIPGFPGNTNGTNLSPVLGNNPTSAAITINTIFNDTTSTNRGIVFLSNQYKPNQSLTNTNQNTISVATIGARTNNVDNVGSLLTIDARQDINLNRVSMNGGISPISLESQGGDVKLLADRNIYLESFIISNGVKSGNITLKSQGDITLNTGAYIQSIQAGNVQGNLLGGNILLDSKSNIYIKGDLKPESIYSATNSSNASAKSGNITIKAKSLLAEDSVEFKTITFGAAQAGDIIFDVSDNIDLNNSSLVSEVRDGASGTGGAIKLKANEIYLNNGSLLDSRTLGTGRGGDITIEGKKLVSFDNSKAFTTVQFINGKKGGDIQIKVNNGSLILNNSSTISSNTLADDDAGDIVLKAQNMEISNQSQITAFTNGVGQGGTITLNADSAININGAASLSVQATKTGNAGGIDIKSKELTIEDGVALTAISETSIGGDIVFSELDNLLINNSNISASTVDGQAGSVIIKAKETVTLTGDTKVSVEAEKTGAAGSLTVNTGDFTIKDGALISAANVDGEGGSIQITANNFTANSGGKLITTTSGSAKAGNITLKIKDSLTIADSDSGLFANTTPGSSGDSGNINIDPPTFIIRDGAGIGVNSKGTGKGGNIDVQGAALTLDNNAFINAETASNQGGEISLQLQDTLVLRRGSRITASAGTNQGGGDGGNITINAPLIVAFPNENSDITANAFQGNGGNINITTDNIFGLEFRPQLTPLSDITVSSEFGVSGNVEINTPGVDPAAGLVELIASFVDAESLVAKNLCALENNRIAGGSSFVVTGKAGLPASSQDSIANSPGIVEWETRSPGQNTSPVVLREVVKTSQGDKKPQSPVIQQVQGWLITQEGKVILTASPASVTPQSPELVHPGCH
jgi:filamentous hemagglutinin family protein